MLVFCSLIFVCLWTDKRPAELKAPIRVCWAAPFSSRQVMAGFCGRAAAVTTRAVVADRWFDVPRDSAVEGLLGVFVEGRVGHFFFACDEGMMEPP